MHHLDNAIRKLDKLSNLLKLHQKALREVQTMNLTPMSKEVAERTIQTNAKVLDYLDGVRFSLRMHQYDMAQVEAILHALQPNKA